MDNSPHTSQSFRQPLRQLSSNITHNNLAPLHPPVLTAKRGRGPRRKKPRSSTDYNFTLANCQNSTITPSLVESYKPGDDSFRWGPTEMLILGELEGHTVAMCKIMECRTILNLTSKKGFDRHLEKHHSTEVNTAFGPQWRKWREGALTVANLNGSYKTPQQLSNQLQWSNQNPWPASHILRPPSFSLLFCPNTTKPECCKSTAHTTFKKKCRHCGGNMVIGWGQTFHPHGGGGYTQWI